MRGYATVGVGWGYWSGPLQKQGDGPSPEKQFVEAHLGQDLIPMDAQSQSSRVWTYLHSSWPPQRCLGLMHGRGAPGFTAA